MVLTRRAFAGGAARVTGVFLSLMPAVGIHPSPVSAAQAGSPPFEVPVDCDMTKVCSIQKYFDQDPGPARLDDGQHVSCLHARHGTPVPSAGI